MRGRKISGYAIVGAICLMLLAVTDIVRIAKYYVPYMFNGFLPYIIIQGIGAAGLIVIAIGRLAKAKTVMLSGSIAYMLCEVIFTYNSLSGIAGSNGFYSVMNLLINIFCLAAAVVLFVLILKCEKSKNLKYKWYIPAGCALFAGIFTVVVTGIGILYGEFAYKMAIILPILFRIAGMLFIGLDLMKIGAEKKVIPNMNGVPNAAYVNNQSRAYQGQPYRAQQPMGNAAGRQYVQQGNPQMQHQQMAGNTQQRYQQMPNINTAQYQQPQSNQQTQYQTAPNSAQYQQTVNNTQSQYQQTQSNAQTQYQQTSNSANAQYQQIQSSKQAQYQQMLNTNQNQQMQANSQSAEQVLTLAEELKKYKELVDAGIITQQEYEEKKKKLLGL